MFYLNDAEIEEPTGWVGVYWERVRRRDFYGIWRHKTASFKGVGEVGFGGSARSILRSLFDQHGINAQATFKVMDGGMVIYSASVDFGIKSDDGRYFHVSFRDENIQLDSLVDLVVSVEPKIQIGLPEQSISAGIEYGISKNVLGSFRVNGSTHAVPLETGRSGEGSGLSVVAIGGIEPIYNNSTDRYKTIKIEGMLQAIWSGSGSFNINIEVTQDGALKESKIVSTLATSGTEQMAYVSGSVDVPPSGYLRLVITGNSGMLATYNQNSYLTLYENAANNPPLIWGLTWKQAVEELLLSLTGGAVTLQSKYLSNANRTLTSERNVRGFKSSMNLSLGKLLSDFIAIENLAVWKRDGVLYVETKADMIKMVGRSKIDFYSTLLDAPSDWFAATIEVGYSNWQSGTAAGRDEICSMRNYVTAQTKASGSVKIAIGNVSASGKTIEALRQTTQSDKADTKQDETIFVIAAKNNGSYYGAITGNVTNAINSANVINGELSPRSILGRWANVLGVNSIAAFSSGTGNTDAMVNGVYESSDCLFNGFDQLFTNNFITMETSLTMRQYAELGEIIEYTDHDGVTRAALIMTDNYRFAAGDVQITALQLNE